MIMHFWQINSFADPENSMNQMSKAMMNPNPLKMLEVLIAMSFPKVNKQSIKRNNG